MNELVAMFKMPLSVEHLHGIAQGIEDLYGKDLRFTTDDIEGVTWLRFWRTNNATPTT